MSRCSENGHFTTFFAPFSHCLWGGATLHLGSQQQPSLGITDWVGHSGVSNISVSEH